MSVGLQVSWGTCTDLCVALSRHFTCYRAVCSRRTTYTFLNMRARFTRIPALLFALFWQHVTLTLRRTSAIPFCAVFTRCFASALSGFARVPPALPPCDHSTGSPVEVPRACIACGGTLLRATCVSSAFDTQLPRAGRVAPAVGAIQIQDVTGIAIRRARAPASVRSVAVIPVALLPFGTILVEAPGIVCAHTYRVIALLVYLYRGTLLLYYFTF